MSAIIEIGDTEWALVEDLFDPPGREGKPARYPRRDVVDAILFLAGTGCQWRYLPARYPPWEAVWQQWQRWRSSGVWAKAMTRIATLIRTRHGRTRKPTMVMIDGQTMRGGRAGPIVIEIFGPPLAVQVDSAKPHDVRSGRELLAKTLPQLGTVKAITADRAYRGLSKMAAALAYLFARLRVEPA